MQRWANGAARLLSWISVIAIVLIGAATLIDIVGRYFNHPLYGAFEMIQIAMIFLVFTALPSVTLQREHVTVDLVQSALPSKVRRVLLVLVGLVGAGTCVFYALQLWKRGAYLERTGEVTSNLLVPVYPFVIFMAVMWAITALCFVVLAVDDTAKLISARGEE
ncbi:TRAP transporter small permease [Amorphus sp. 3PC139-8]|uniref:TRAP transporter small permease n=1 Tax=Amorphus sp. 3PC139-8 TaxID=2735676 RepID=UPI00345D341E